MKTQWITKAAARSALYFIPLAAATLWAGCQCPPPVRECAMAQPVHCARPALNPPIPTICTTALQTYPDGNRHLAGGPLYYDESINWEQAPPFGRW